MFRRDNFQNGARKGKSAKEHVIGKLISYRTATVRDMMRVLR